MKDSMVIWVNSTILKFNSKKWKDRTKKLCTQGKCHVILSHCQLLFFLFSSLAFMYTTYDWGENVGDIIAEIIEKCSVESRYLLLDEGGDVSMEASKDLYELARKGRISNWSVILAATSGYRWKGDKYLTRLAFAVQSRLQNEEVKPFTIKEAHQFLKLHGVNESWHIKIVDVAGTVPSMLGLFRSVTSQEDFLDSKERMKLILEDMVQDMRMEITGRCNESIANSVTWLGKACRNSVVYLSEEEDSKRSYVAHEFLTYLVEEKIGRNALVKNMKHKIRKRARLARLVKLKHKFLKHKFLEKNTKFSLHIHRHMHF